MPFGCFDSSKPFVWVYSHNSFLLSYHSNTASILISFSHSSGLLGVSAQEVPSSPHRPELPVEETSLTLHGRTPLKDHPYTVEGGGQWATGRDQHSLFSLYEEGEQEQEDSRQFGMSHDMQLHSEPGTVCVLSLRGFEIAMYLSLELYD